MPRMATWRPTPRWCWPRKPRQSRAISPKQIAEKLRADDLIAKVDVAGPGFINLTAEAHRPGRTRCAPCCARRDYGQARSARRKGQRRICLGQSDRADACRPLPRRGVRRCARQPAGFAGYDVTREYYINDAGAQVDVLARSAFLRYREALGEDIGAIPEGLYPGDYLKPVGQALAAEYGRQAQGDAGERVAADRARAKAIA
jgi:arginyl-tRNA synthetase